MNIPVGVISSTEFANVFMAQPGLTAVPNTNPQIYTLPRETIIEVFPSINTHPWATPPGTYTVVNYDSRETIVDSFHGGIGMIIEEDPIFNLRDQNGNNRQLRTRDEGMNNVQIKKLNGRPVGWQAIRTLTAIRPTALDALERSVIRTNAPPNLETGFPGGPGYLEALQELATINDALDSMNTSKGGKKSRKTRKSRKSRKARKARKSRK